MWISMHNFPNEMHICNMAKVASLQKIDGLTMPSSIQLHLSNKVSNFDISIEFWTKWREIYDGKYSWNGIWIEEVFKTLTSFDTRLMLCLIRFCIIIYRITSTNGLKLYNISIRIRRLFEKRTNKIEDFIFILLYVKCVLCQKYNQS